ncbi:MAG: tetratricopeptide repeat protein [Gemmatimonadota bacterium]
MPTLHTSGMVKFFRVKEKARGLARQQKFDEALAEYRAAIARAETEHDLPALRNLYNATGDASLEKNDTATAVEYFMKAAGSYLEEGLHDNAIALCHKILRHVPTKVDVYALLGRIYGDKGLRNESIHNWLEYAERREKAGDLAGVTRALREVLALSPGSDAVRQQLVEVLLSQGERQAGLAELEALRRRAQEAGDDARAGELEKRVETLRAELGAEAGEPAELSGPGRPQAASGDFDLQRFEPAAPGEEGRSPAPAEASDRVSGLESGFGFSVESPGLAPPPEAPPAPAESPPGAPSAAPEASPAGAERGEADAQPPVWTLPGFTPPEVDDPASAASRIEVGEREPSRVPHLAEESRLDVGQLAYVPVEERIERAEARLAADPADADERLYLSELYQEAGTLDLARAAAAQAAAELLQSGQQDAAYRAYRRVVTLAPDELETVQKLVEVAQASGRREHLLESYELLGDRLMAGGDYARAREIHRRLLEIDPDHRHSQDQLLILEGLEGVSGERREVAPASPGDMEYVDLGRLIAESELERSADPRIRTSAQPTGDEQADLQAIIEAFRRGVAENIAEADFESHYDLGVAFRDMGLLDEAIREFQLAARGGDHRERAFELMGLCFREKGMVTVAVNCFRRGIESGGDSHEALGLRYHLARSFEELGKHDSARAEYEKVLALDVQFLDAADRLRQLG